MIHPLLQRFEQPRVSRHFDCEDNILQPEWIITGDFKPEVKKEDKEVLFLCPNEIFESIKNKYNLKKQQTYFNTFNCYYAVGDNFVLVNTALPDCLQNIFCDKMHERFNFKKFVSVGFDDQIQHLSGISTDESVTFEHSIEPPYMIQNVAASFFTFVCSFY